MPQLHYIAYKDEARVTGTMVASSPEHLAAQLRDQGFVVTEVRTGPQAGPGLFQSRQGLRLQDKIALMQNLGTFLASGVPITRALELTISDASPALARVLESVLADLKTGQSLSASLGKFPTEFDPVILALVEAGEATGKLNDIFKALGARFKQDARIVSKVRSAFVYPGIVFGALFVLGLVLAFFVLPRVTGVFERFAIDLPAVTRLLIGLSKLLNAQPLLTLLGIGLLGSGTVAFVSSTTGKAILLRLATHLPGVKQVFWNLDLERFTSTLAILIDAGVPIQRSLAITARTVSNPRLAEQIPVAARRLATGQSLSAALETTHLPHSLISLLAAGEESGALAANLKELEAFYHDALDESIRNVTALVEPLLTLVVGLIVGTVVIAIIVPIYQLVGQLNPVGTP